MKYRNLSQITKIFYDTEFPPLGVNEVPGYINDIHMFPLPDDYVISDNSVETLKAEAAVETTAKAKTTTKTTAKEQAETSK